MKNELSSITRRTTLLILAFLSTLRFQLSTDAQGTAFIYQGRLNDGGASANGTNYGMVFYIYDAPTGGTVLGNFGIVSMTISNGLFTAPLDFGNVFSGAPRWLEITVQKNGGSFTTLSPRQPITPAPYAITAANLSSVLENNSIHSGLNSPTLSGGSENAITTGGNFATIGGGENNTNSGTGATIGGGEFNVASGFYSTVGGGFNNTASGDSATVPGGNGNTARGFDSFAAGNYANAKDNGSFVWADDNVHTFSSTTTNQFRVRATGGVAFVTGVDGSGGVTAGVHLLSGDTAWSSISDKNAKKNFRPINAEMILEKLATIPVEQWNYKWEDDEAVPHLGPMAQDFKAAFYPGRDDKSISTLEFDGVELAAIQGVNEKLEVRSRKSEARSRELEQRLEQKETELADVKQRLEKLERLLERRDNTRSSD
jgi:hypothetical protein